jgi:hypothetical protein
VGMYKMWVAQSPTWAWAVQWLYRSG